VLVWTFLSTKLLKASMADYYQTKTDFARQLDSFRPNPKFEAPEEESEVHIYNYEYGLTPNPNYYQTKNDFARQLDSFRPNPKFEAPEEESKVHIYN